MAETLETDIPGTPGDYSAAGTWLRGTLATELDSGATTVLTQRTRAASDWQGQAGTAFAGRARTLASGADSAHDTLGLVATDLDGLGTALSTAQSDMATVRSHATAGGLTVTGTVVHHPGTAPPSAGTLAADATPAESTTWHDRNDAVLAYNKKIEVWNTAVTDANACFGDWQKALDNGAATWTKYDSELVGVSADFLTAAAEVALIAKAVPILVKESEALRTQASNLRAHAETLKDPLGRVVDRAHYYDLLDRADDLDGVRAPQVYDDAVKFKLPKGIGRGLGVLGAAAAGYGIYSDMQDGESAAQATVSNVAGFGASIAAGAWVGGAIGTAIPVPVVGTVVGVVVGAAVGTVVGAFTSGVIDSVWENGVDSLGDAGGAVMDGLGEVADTGAAIGDLASGAWDALF